MDTAAALLIGMAIVELIVWLRAHNLAWVQVQLALGGIVLLLLAMPYLYLVFVQQPPANQLIVPTARAAIYRTIYPAKLPTGSDQFGLPHRAGWKVIGELYRKGVLQGDFDSNEDWLITHWYTRETPRCGRDPDYYFLAQTPVDRAKLPIDQIRKNYHLFGSVLVDGVKEIEIYSRRPPAQPVQDFVLADATRMFDEHPIVSFTPPGTLYQIQPQSHPDTSWQGGVLLQWHGQDYTLLAPGQAAMLWFHWQATAAIDKDYQLAVDVLDSKGTIVASAQPLCRPEPPAEWHNHGGTDVSFTLTGDPRMLPGMYTIQVGFRQRHTGAWLRLANGGDALTVATLTVMQP
jgi:hypothetical protein